MYLKDVDLKRCIFPKIPDGYVEVSRNLTNAWSKKQHTLTCVHVLTDPTWSWWTSCWSVGMMSGCGSAGAYRGNVSNTGGRCAEASVTPAHPANWTLSSTPPPQHPPRPGLSLCWDPRSSQLERWKQRTAGGSVRLKTKPNLVSLCLWNPTLLLHRLLRVSADKAHTDHALIISVVICNRSIQCSIAGVFNLLFFVLYWYSLHLTLYTEEINHLPQSKPRWPQQRTHTHTHTSKTTRIFLHL